MASLHDRLDCVVIGGGLVGLAIARELLSEGAPSLAVLEAEERLATHQSGRNSGVLHSGLYYPPGSLKATLCTDGRRALAAYCEERSLPWRRTGKLIVATRDEQLPRLEELLRRGRANGLSGLERVDASGIREREPAARGVAGLWVPQTGVVDFAAVAEALAADIAGRGGSIRTGHRVRACRRLRDGWELKTSRGPLACRVLINCGGLHSDRLARLCGVAPEVRIVPFRGEYREIGGAAAARVRGLIYPVPDPDLPFLGVHVTRMVDGRVLAGPNAVPALARHGYRRSAVSPRDLLDCLLWPGTWRLAWRLRGLGLHELALAARPERFAAELRELMPQVAREDLRPARSGVRAQAVDRRGRLVDDFRIVASERAVHVLNAPSPAATACLAIGRHVASVAGRSICLSRSPTARSREPR